MLEFKNLYKQYKTNKEPVKALDGFSLNVGENQIFALAGINGAGKTTTFKALFGLIQLDEGDITISKREDSSSKVLGFAPEIPDLPDYMTVEEVLAFSCRLAGYDAEPKNINRCLAMFELEGQRSKLIKTLSKGNRQRVSLASAIVYNADIVVFDEPTSGLDPMGRRLIKNVMKELKSEGKTILFSTHILADLPEICDKMAVMHKGRTVFYGKVSEFSDDTSLEGLENRFAQIIGQD